MRIHKLDPFSPARLLALIGWLAVANPLLAQDVLWDRIGDGVREVSQSSFDVLGDVSGDGVQDFITGITKSALVVVHSGADETVVEEYFLPAAAGFGTGFGVSVAGLGDFDGDSFPDYAMGANKYSDQAIGAFTGLVLVRSGTTRRVIARIPGLIPGEGFAHEITALGDVNGDGLADLAVSSFSGFRTRIYSGPSGALVREHLGAPATQHNVASYGDYDGDGCDDYLIGIPGYGAVVPGGGRVELFSGRTGQLLLGMNGNLERRQAGFSVSRGGDWNGDGIGDIVAGAPGTGILQNTTYLAGAYVFSGADGSILHFFDGEQYCKQNSAFGWSVSSGKDLNGDGVPDLVVGAPMEPYDNTPGVSVRGSAFVFSGATKAVLWEHTGENVAEHAGLRVRLIDDHNGDGLADWMVMAPNYDATPEEPIGVDNGRLTLFAGAAGDVLASCNGGQNSTGQAALLTSVGSLGIEENHFELLLAGMPGSHLALLLNSTGLAAPVPFGAGELCLLAPNSVLAALVTSDAASGDAPGQASQIIDLTASPFSSGGQRLQPGASWAFQAVYREGGVRNTTNALGVVFLP